MDPCWAWPWIFQTREPGSSRGWSRSRRSDTQSRQTSLNLHCEQPEEEKSFYEEGSTQRRVHWLVELRSIIPLSKNFRDKSWTSDSACRKVCNRSLAWFWFWFCSTCRWCCAGQMWSRSVKYHLATNQSRSNDHVCRGPSCWRTDVPFSCWFFFSPELWGTSARAASDHPLQWPAAGSEAHLAVTWTSVTSPGTTESSMSPCFAW